MKHWLVCIAVVVSVAVHATDAGDGIAREEIRQRRQVIEADHVARQAECRKRFAVTSCLDEARAAQQEAVRALRQQELALNDAQRRQRSEEQTKRLANKAQKALDHAQPGAKEKPRPAALPHPSHLRKTKAAEPEAVDRKGKEQAARERYEARQREIRSHREEVEQRNAKRAASKPASPLPLPPGASSP